MSEKKICPFIKWVSISENVLESRSPHCYKEKCMAWGELAQYIRKKDCVQTTGCKLIER